MTSATMNGRPHYGLAELIAAAFIIIAALIVAIWLVAARAPTRPDTKSPSLPTTTTQPSGAGRNNIPSTSSPNSLTGNNSGGSGNPGPLNP